MQFRSFTSLDELNKFLTEELGEPAVTIEELKAKMEPEKKEDDEGEPISKSAFDAYIEFTSYQIVRLVEERDAATKALDMEIKIHLDCHEGMQEYAHKMRIQGYCEAMSSYVYKGTLFEDLDDATQASARDIAITKLQKLDEIRAANRKGEAKSDSFH